jgi:hypothetical protein
VGGKSMPSQEFIETYPLYRKYEIELPPWLYNVPKPPINMHCFICLSNQTFNMINEYDENRAGAVRTGGEVVRALYRCSACNKFFRYFFFLFDPNEIYVIKVGQIPSWEISLDRNLEKMLGDHADY